MTGLISVKNKIRDFIRQFDEILEPVFCFILAYIMFSSLQSMYGYSDLFDRKIVIFLLSVISALVSSQVVVLLGMLLVLMNSFAVSLEVGISMLVVLILLYCLYMRMFPDTAWVLAFVPIMCMWKLTFAIPILVMMFAGAAGIVPTAFGLVMYNISLYIRNIATEHMTDDEEFQAYTYLVEQISKNKDMILLMIVFAAVIMISYIVYRLPFKYCWYIGIAVAALLNIIVFSIESTDATSIQMGDVIKGSFLGLLIALIVQVCKNIADYSKVERVQFEDDDFYYYVKAVPKLGGNTKKKKTGNHGNDNSKMNEMKTKMEHATQVNGQLPETAIQSENAVEQNHSNNMANVQNRNVQNKNVQNKNAQNRNAQNRNKRQ